VDSHIPIPTIESIKAGLVGCKVFSKLDFRSSFHQLALAKSSQTATVFCVNGALYHLKQLPMGVKPASGEFMRAIQETFSDIPGLHAVHDDVIIAGTNYLEHDRSLTAFLERLLAAGMTLNPNKCLLRQREIPFWGMRVSADGVRPDPERVRRLRDAEAPTNWDELILFLCMARSNADFHSTGNPPPAGSNPKTQQVPVDERP
jgi:hypothetical protein